MPQSLSNVLLHVIFSTKNRDPFLRDAGLRRELHAYMAGALRKIDCPSVIVGGVADHVHFLCRLSRTVSIAQLIVEAKTDSSRWMKRAQTGLADFYWQGGYAAFSVSPSNADRVKRYIEDQESHHCVRTFQEELRALLRRHSVEYDERYIWD